MVYDTTLTLSESKRLIRWILILEEFGPNIQHISGVENIVSFFWSVIRDYIACSLLGGIIPSQNSGYTVTRIGP